MTLVGLAARGCKRAGLPIRHHLIETLPPSGYRLHQAPRSLRRYSSTQPPKPPTSTHNQPGSTDDEEEKFTRHDAQEGNVALNIPFNASGGSGGPVNIGPGGGGIFHMTKSPLFDAALTTVIGLGMVFAGGIAYVKWYKQNVLDKIEQAFAAGYDPALDLASQRIRNTSDSDEELADRLPPPQNLRRKEQDWVDRIVQGQEPGHYFVLLGPKGSGKGTMVFDAMAAVQADGIAVCDAHPDLEVFRLRLGKALNFEYFEDSQTGLFQRRDPREGGPALDIERAFNKLEKVAIKCANRRGKPLVLIINNIHFFKNDDDGRAMLLQLQQRAEAWAASGILTMVFSTDDFWPYFHMHKTASRMHVLSIYDLVPKEALHACTSIRAGIKRKCSKEEATDAISFVGGRLSYLNRVCHSKDMSEMARHLLAVEKGWLMSQIGLIPDCDDDVMDEQKWSSCSWLLLQEFVKIREEQEQEYDERIKNGEIPKDDIKDIPLPAIPYWRCRQIMTRADFIEDLDRYNIIAIDENHDVRPDSLLILRAAQEVCGEEGFQEILDGVRERIDEIESLHRTRELTFKDINSGDRIRLWVDKDGSDTVIS